MKRFFLIILATLMVFSCSCQKTPTDPSEDEVTEQPEPQHMAYHLSVASRVGDDIYFVSGSSFDKAQIFAAEYGTENFEPFIPCFDSVCNHLDRTKCCLATGAFHHYTDTISAFMYDGEPALLLFGFYDISLSKPYSNKKLNLACDDIVYMEYPKEDSEIAGFLEAISSAPRRSNPLIYEDYFYYTEINNGTRTQYRVPLIGGEPERVFEEDNVIVKTIINDRFYGIRYEKDDENNTQMYYFRSDMNYENVETLPEILDFFELPNKDNLRLTATVILNADSDFIYVLHNMKFWKIPDSDINAEPILLSDMSEIIPSDLPNRRHEGLWYNDGVLYAFINIGIYERPTLDSTGFPNPTQWYESSTLYSFDIRTGECMVWDITDQDFLITKILYADGDYVYAKGKYAHDDNRVIQEMIMRLTLDTMRYEVILPDRFWEYSAETAS